MLYSNLIYNQSIISQFKNCINTNSIPNAFIFYGNEGVGKFGHAIELSYMIFDSCLSKSDRKSKIEIV